MAAPQLFRPAAVVWFAFSHLLGTIVSTVILSVIFFLVVTPVGVFRRLIGADSLRLREFRKSRASVMTERRHRFVAKDLEQPY